MEVHYGTVFDQKVRYFAALLNLFLMESQCSTGSMLYFVVLIVFSVPKLLLGAESYVAFISLPSISGVKVGDGTF